MMMMMKYSPAVGGGKAAALAGKRFDRHHRDHRHHPDHRHHRHEPDHCNHRHHRQHPTMPMIAIIAIWSSSRLSRSPLSSPSSQLLPPSPSSRSSRSSRSSPTARRSHFARHIHPKQHLTWTVCTDGLGLGAGGLVDLSEHCKVYHTLRLRPVPGPGPEPEAAANHPKAAHGLHGIPYGPPRSATMRSVAGYGGR